MDAVKKRVRKLSWGMMLLFLLPAFCPIPDADWPAWIAGARLAGNAERLYSFRGTGEITGTFADPNRTWAFVRPPVYASMLRPLAWIPPTTAFIAWQLLNVAAIVAAARLLWPSYKTPFIALLFFPLAVSLRNGQDTPFFVLAVAVAARMMKRAPTPAGVALSFLGLKFHLILLLPLYFVVRRSWRMLSGFALGGTLLLASCFALYGWSWPSLYFRFIFQNERLIPLGLVPIPALSPLWWTLLAASGIVAAVLMRRIKDDRAALFTVLAISLVPASHLYGYDVSIVFPLILWAFQSEEALGASHRTLPETDPAWQA